MIYFLYFLRLRARTDQWKYTEAVPNAPGEPPNPSPVLPDIEGVHTGLFLQHFTNSVNKALHKQHCTCKGKIYTSEDLFEKSNPALFGRSKSEIVYSPQHRKTVKLPRLRNDASLVGGNVDIAIEEKGKPPLQVQIEREARDIHMYGMYLQTLDENDDTVFNEDGEIRLPNLMDIHDLEGNSWKIIQEPKKSRDSKQKSRFDRKLFGDAISDYYEEPKSRSAKSNTSNGRDIKQESDKPKKKFIDVMISSAIPNNSDAASISESSLHSTSSEMLPKMEPLCNTAPAHTTQIRSPPFVCDEMGRKALLWRYASEVRKGEITYRDYLTKISDISSLYRDDAGGNKGQKREHSPQKVVTADGDLIKIPRADVDIEAENNGPVLLSLSSAYEHQCAAVNFEPSFPPELEVLYSKAGLSVSNLTDSFSKTLPENFLQREKERLRSDYPMYDWKLQQKHQKLPSGHNERAYMERPVRSEPLASNLRRIAGIGPRDFDHKMKVLSNRSGADQDVVNIRSSQFFDRRGELNDIPETESVKKLVKGDEESSRIESGISRSFPPNQPPTTPVEVALTFASCSVPNMMETMEEETETGQEDEENEDDEKETSERKMEEHGDIITEHPDSNHMTRTGLATARSQRSERSWREGFDGKMYKVSKEGRVKFNMTERKQRHHSFDSNAISKGDEISTVSDVIPPNPYNSNENLNDLGLSTGKQVNDITHSFKMDVTNSWYSKPLPVTLLGVDTLPDIQTSGLRSRPRTVRRKNSSKSEFYGKNKKEPPSKQFSTTQTLTGSARILPVSLSTKHVVFISPTE